MATLAVDSESMEYVRACAEGLEITHAEALARLCKLGFSRSNALLRHSGGVASKAWPAPGRKAKKAAAK